MWRASVLFCVVLACASACKSHAEKKHGEHGPSDEGPLVRSPSGQFRGSWMTSRRGRQFEAYRGIKYAEPPVGKLRFQPPKPILSYKGEVNASDDGPACPLIAPDDYYVDEDCLTINVYTPRSHRSKPLPVVFFIHPGGFYSMTGRSDVAGPHYLLDKDLVLVTINYRLGSLGFLSTGDELAPGNNGFKDQVVALKWVRRNIRGFGGDPNLVTITGVSAGSISVLLHMISPMSKGLFHRGISISGSPIGKEPLFHHQFDLAVKQAQILNCPYDNSSVIIDCLKSKSYRELGNSLFGFYQFGWDPVGIWQPVVELDFGQERFLAIQPADAIREGKMHAVPHIISQTTDEFFWNAFNVVRNETLLTRMNAEWEQIAPISFQLPKENASLVANRLKDAYLEEWPLKNDDKSAFALGKIYGDAIVGFNTHRMANLMCRHSPRKVFYYEFAYIGNHSWYEDSVTMKPRGAAHHDDMLYLFTLSFRYPAIPADHSRDSFMVDRMTTIWYNFARYGDPNPPPSENQPELTVHWPAMTPAERKYLRVAEPLSVRARIFEDRFKLWDELYPLDY
ncbi:venom carboxylesterase-6-like [Ostrinia furnacalis]|uniref:venom carboxylesterase-6-like n=1 Tax=Ostrinia furnacalis TaxID=93504 RepID=UPI001040975C|nr:venom carboxylesterase-6-like [Ostrinia furnacalis]